MMKLFLSVITVSLNSEVTIEKTIQSVLNQSYTNFEYVIIDGKSTDKTLNIIQSFEKEFNQKGISLKWISESDKGLYDAINKGIKLCNGKFISVLNSDDWYENDVVESVLNHYTKTKALYIHGNINLYSEKKEFIRTAKAGKLSQISKKMPFFHPASFINKDIYDKLGGYSLEYKICADYDFIINIINNNFAISHLNKVLTNFSLGGVSTSRIKDALKESHIVRVNNGYNRLLSKFYYFVEIIICKIKYH